MNPTLKNLNLIVTGAFGTLGQAVWQLAAERGARVCLIDRAEALADSRHVPADAVVIGGVDLSNAEHTQQAMERAALALGSVDALVNVAGGFQWQNMTGSSIDAWDRMYHINLGTAVHACYAAIPHLRSSQRGRIVNIAATAALHAAAGMGAYAASKAGVLKLTEALASELEADGVRVNAVLPSIIDTEQNRKEMPSADRSNWVAPQDLAKVVMFLLSDDANGMSGAALPVTIGHRCAA